MRWKQSFFWPRATRGSIPISSVCSMFSIIYKFCAVSLLSITYIFRQSSDSCQAAIRQSSGSRQAFVRPLSGRRQAVIRQSSGSRQYRTYCDLILFILNLPYSRSLEKPFFVFVTVFSWYFSSLQTNSFEIPHNFYLGCNRIKSPPAANQGAISCQAPIRAVWQGREREILSNDQGFAKMHPEQRCC